MPSFHCKHSTCPAIIPQYGYCDKHRPQENKDRAERDKRYDETRDKEVIAFYNSSAWKATRQQQLAVEPFCQQCLKAIATDVHHVIPVKESKELRLDYGNLMSLCGECHKRLEAKRKWAKYNREKYGK